MNEKEKCIERCREILAELNQMPLDVYVSFVCGILIHFRKYHPLDWKSLERFMAGEIPCPFPLAGEIIVEEIDVKKELPWSYSVFKAMYETVKTAYHKDQE